MALSGKVHGKTGSFTIGDSGSVVRDISPDLDEVDGLPGATEVADSTGLGAVAKTFLVGLSDVKFSVKGQFNDTALTGSHTVLSGIRGLSARAFVYSPAGVTVGYAKITGSAIMTHYKLTAPVAGIVKFQADFQGSGDVTFGVN